jgi:hypothetical protein
MSRLDDCPNLSRLEWDIFGGPVGELSDLRPYEFLRHAPRVRSAVKKWREFAHEQSFECLRELDQSGRRSPLMSRVCSFWPEWPDWPYLSVPERERLRRRSILYPGDETTLIAEQLEPDPALLLDSEEGFRNAIRQLQKNWRAGRKLGLCPSDFEEHQLLRIPWWQSDTEILSIFKTWLKVNSPPGRKLSTPQGRGTFERRARADLKALAAMRVLRANDGDWMLPPALYSEQSEWINARNHAAAIIERLSQVLR